MIFPTFVSARGESQTPPTVCWPGWLWGWAGATRRSTAPGLVFHSNDGPKPAYWLDSLRGARRGRSIVRGRPSGGPARRSTRRAPDLRTIAPTRPGFNLDRRAKPGQVRDRVKTKSPRSVW